MVSSYGVKLSMEEYEAILLMKVGPYCGYSLDEIIDIKKKEEKLYGKFYWGYSGVFCHPRTINAFVSYCLLNNLSPKVLMVETKSSYDSEDAEKLGQYSVDGSVWNELDNKVNLVGNAAKPHCAVTARNLQEIDIEINLSDYCVFRGMIPDMNKNLSEYFKYRVDKACALFNPGDRVEKIVSVKYSAELVEPFGMYIKK